MELVLTISYWTLLTYDPALILDTRTAGQPPLLIDMGFHLFPAIFLSLDSMLAPPLRMSKRNGFFVIAGIVGTYWIWAILCENKNGFWIYPIIGRLRALEMAAGLMSWVGIVWGVWCLIEWKKGCVQGGDMEGSKFEMKTR
jgi:FAR-17a/AIG1-like protein